MDKNCILVRGIVGSGKSSFAEFIGGVVCCADDYFMVDGEYKFDGAKLKQAHESCKLKFEHAVLEGQPKIVVANTNTQEWEFAHYKSFAEKNGYRVFCVIVENRHGGTNVHGVPDNVIEQQKKRFQIKL